MKKLESEAKIKLEQDQWKTAWQTISSNKKKAKITNAFAINTSTDIKPSKTQFPKKVQLGGFLRVLLNKCASPLMKVAVPLAKTCWHH